jgi:hypothetical protein
MTKGRSVAIIGNNVAAMFAAITLGEADWKVSLISPSPRLGGHFAGLNLHDRIFDAGMVFLEFTSYNSTQNADVASYEPTRRNDVGRFFPLVEQTLSRFSGWRRVDAPVMHIDGRKVPDLLIANDLEALSALPPETRSRMAREVEAILERSSGRLHASRKTTDIQFGECDLESVSLANHGRTFHDLFIAPFCRKVSTRHTASLLALYHRMVWLPLYYPETLASQLAEGRSMLPETVFAYPESGALATMISQIAQHVRTLPNVDVIEAKVNTLVHKQRLRSFTINTTTGAAITVDELVWASEPEALLRLCGETVITSLERTSLALVSVLVPSDEIDTTFSTMLIPQNEGFPFRITNQSHAAGEQDALSRLSCEWNTSFVTDTSEAVDDRTRAALVELNVIRRPESVAHLRVDMFQDALPLPTATNAKLSSQRGAQLDELLPGVLRVGAAAAFGAASLNDQVVQGLKVGRELCESR